MKTIHVKLCIYFLFSIGFLMSCKEKEDEIVPIYDLQIEGQDYFLLTIGEQKAIKYKIIPIHTTDKTLKWTSDDESVATVVDGIITGVNTGNTRILGVSNSNPEMQLELLVRVNPVTVTSVTLDAGPVIEMDLNEELSMTATVMPANASQEVIWKSTDESVISVSSDGVIKALQYGEAVISATSVSEETKSGSVRVVVVGLVETLLDKQKFSPLPHSSQFTFSVWGTSNIGALWNSNFSSNATAEVFYIENKPVTYFGVNLGVQAKLTSMRFWGRNDNYFVLRHPKKIQIYGTNDPAVANNPESSDSQWILLSGDLPFESIRPSGESGVKPATGTPDWTYANVGERFSFSPSMPAVKYIRFKSLETWGKIDGLWLTEIAFWGQEVE